VASFSKFQVFSEHVSKGVHNLEADTLMVYFSNVAPNLATHQVKADLAEIAGGNGYTAGGYDTQNTLSRASGVTSIIGVDVSVIASGGAIPAFQYVVLFNNTPSSPLKPLLGVWDYGAPVTLQPGSTFLTDFGASMFTVT
jgi:hypothetical protein